MDVEPGGAAGDGRGGSASGGPSGGSSRAPSAGPGGSGAQGARSKVWAVLAVAAVCYFVAGAVFSLLDESWVQAAFRLAAAAFLASWLVRNHGPRAGRWSQDRPSAGPGGSPGRDDH